MGIYSWSMAGAGAGRVATEKQPHDTQHCAGTGAVAGARAATRHHIFTGATAKRSLLWLCLKLMNRRRGRGVAMGVARRERRPRDLRRLEYKEGILEGLASTRETELAVCIQPEREDLTGGEPHLMSQAIRARQKSSEVIRGHQRSSEVIRGHQRSSVVSRTSVW